MARPYRRQNDASIEFEKHDAKHEIVLVKERNSKFRPDSCKVLARCPYYV